MKAPMTLEQMLKKDLRMVFLSSLSGEEFRKAVDMVKEIRSVPFGQGPHSIIIPADMVPKLEKKGLAMMAVLKPFNKADLTLEQCEDMGNRRAGIWTFHTISFFINKEITEKLADLSRKEYRRNKEPNHGKTKKA